MAKKAVVSCLLMMFMFFGLAMANIYEVGDSAGWTSSGVDYKKWSSSKHFQVGDFLLFEFDPNSDNVIPVLKEEFNACNASSPFGTPTTGTEWVPLDSEGHFYFISSVPGHCQAGQKVEVRVLSASPAASPAEPTPIPALVPPTTNPLSPGPSDSATNGSL